MSIRDWPADERPREKLLLKGAAALSDAELLAIFLRIGIKGKSAVDLARDLLCTFGSLSALLSASKTDFCAQLGLGDAKYSQLQAVLEMARRHYAQPLSQTACFNDAQSVKTYLISELKDQHYEEFCCLWLNSKHQLIKFVRLFRGSIQSATVHPREVVQQALAHNAAAVIFAHNHPGGSMQASDADIRITQKLTDILQTIDIKVLDHIIVAQHQAMSFAEHGLIIN